MIVSNYLAALMEAACADTESPDSGAAEALRMMEPLVRETVRQRSGSARRCMTARSRAVDGAVLHARSMRDGLGSGVAAIYRQLGAIALELARAQAKADPKALDAIARTLGTIN